jgi:hypothetical protein
MEAFHPLAPGAPNQPQSPIAPRSQARRLYQINPPQPTSAYDLAGQLATAGLSPREIPFILYTADKVAICRTPTQPAEPHPHTLPDYYFRVALHRPNSDSGSSDNTLADAEAAEDELLMVIADLTQVFSCRHCQRQMEAHDLAMLVGMQLWCGDCGAAYRATSFARHLAKLYPAGGFTENQPLYPARVLVKGAVALVRGQTTSLTLPPIEQ